MKQRAYAKINLCLDVVRRREDGYHELEMIMAPVNLYDTLNFEFSDELRLQSNVPYLPLDRRNTIVKAIELLRDPKMKIYEISEEVGYSDVQYFNKVFRDTTGVSPSFYRNHLLYSSD